MNIVLWVLAVLLGLAFAAAGVTKLTKSRAQLVEANMGWVEDFSSTMVKTIGGLEILGSLGLIASPLVGLPIFVPLAAVGLMLLMIGAAITHQRRHEAQMIAVNASLLVVAAVVAWGRLGPYPL